MIKDSLKRKGQLIAIFLFTLAFPLCTIAEEVKISSLDELATYAARSGNTIRMEPGLYKLSEFISADSIHKMRAAEKFQFLTFSGNDNYFKLGGVIIEVDTELRSLLKAPIHNNEFLISGRNNTIEGLNIVHIGNGTSPGGAALSIGGEGNILKDATLVVKGSFPYGYGDLFGKGGPDVISHQKQSGIQITGENISLYGCKLYMRSFGHGYYIQNGGEDVYFEDCYVEGEMRSTDDVLEETSGPAFDVDFRTWTPNREGKYVVTPGYMKSLAEDGFRTYGGIQKVSFKNCTVKNMRGGFELRTDSGVRLENCTTIGTERAFWVGGDAQMINCKGDAAFGPLLFLEGSNVSVELEVLPGESDRKVHSLATIQGNNNKVVLKSGKGKSDMRNLPILIGYTHPEHGEAMSPYGTAPVNNLDFRNETTYPIEINENVRDSRIYTRGEIIENKGVNNKVIRE